MVVFSKLAPALNLLRNVRGNVLLVAKRDGHARVLAIRVGTATTWRLYDYIHFYTMIGVLFWGSIILYLNTVYGACELQEIPEGYEPRYWEYEHKPLTQLLQRYFGMSPMKNHDKMVAIYAEMMKDREWKYQENRVHHLMFERGDYKGWYYIPYKAKWIEWSNWRYQKLRENRDPTFIDPRLYA